MIVDRDGQKIVAMRNIDECKDRGSQLGLDLPHEMNLARQSIRGVGSKASLLKTIWLSQTNIRNNNKEGRDLYSRVIILQWARACPSFEESSCRSGGDERDTPQSK